MIKKDQEKRELATEALKALSEIEATTKVENMLQDNKLYFEVKDKKYRLRFVNAQEQDELNDVRRKKYIEMVNDDTYLFRKQWIKKYKDKGIDIEDMENKIREYHHKERNLLLRLAEIKDNDSIKKIKDEVLNIREEQQALAVEKTELLSYSIEDQLTMFTLEYTAYLCLEKEDNKEWKKAFENFQNYRDCEDSELVNKSLIYINYLLYGVGA